MSSECLNVICPTCQKEMGEHYIYIPTQCIECRTTMDIVPNQLEANERARAFHGTITKQGDRWLVSYGLQTD